MNPQPEPRCTARVILQDGAGRVWLIEGRDPGEPQRAPFWFTPGGKIDPGEAPAEAAARELAEETGIVVAPHQLGPVIGTEESQYRFLGVTYRQTSVFYRLIVADAALAGSERWTEIERQTILSARWWTRQEIAAATCDIYPAHLTDLMA